jgi:nucleotidyltransferase substrate binding protein (TIGR01987 family)
MKSDVVLARKKLRRSVQRLSEIIQKPVSDVVRDATIQRFEFTYELLWKTTKMALEHEGILVKSPKETFQEAFRLRWIREEKLFLRMLEARNAMAHLYDEQEARAIAKEIRQKYLHPIQQLLLGLEKLK